MRFIISLSVVLAVTTAAPLAVKADIIGTDASATMHVRYAETEDLNLITDIEGSSSGTSSATLNLTGSITGMNVSSNLEFADIDSTSADLEFSMGMHGNKYVGLLSSPQFHPQYSYDCVLAYRYHRRLLQVYIPPGDKWDYQNNPTPSSLTVENREIVNYR